MEKRIPIIIAGAIAVAIAAAAGGFFLGRSGGQTASVGNGARGAFAQLSDSERAQLQNMTEEERTAFFKQKGIDMPAGGPVGAGANGTAPGGIRGGGGLLEGKVAALSDDSLTIELASGGSSKVDLTAETVKASADGAGTLAVGSSVMVSAVPEAEGVMTAQLVVVR